MDTLFDKAFVKVKLLSTIFRTNESRYLSPAYQEAEVRKDFIDKFFAALGWDVNHDEQTDPYAQEVKVERGVETRTVDYAFFLKPNYRDAHFLVEAKKPSKNIESPDFYFQTIRYGCNANCPVCVLTDFEQFHILDCRHKPDIDSALSGRYLKCIKLDLESARASPGQTHYFGKNRTFSELYSRIIPRGP